MTKKKFDQNPKAKGSQRRRENFLGEKCLIVSIGFNLSPLIFISNKQYIAFLFGKILQQPIIEILHQHYKKPILI
jgi:hypothetical protein